MGLGQLKRFQKPTKCARMNSCCNVVPSVGAKEPRYDSISIKYDFPQGIVIGKHKPETTRGIYFS